MAILASVTIVTMVTMNAQQVYAPRNCGGCAEFQKLTDEFEKAVLDAAAVKPAWSWQDTNVAWWIQRSHEIIPIYIT